MQPDDKRITLEEVKKHFDVWRETRPQGRRQVIPEALWDEVRQIAHHHAPSHITRVLHMSMQQYKQHVNISVADQSEADDIQFVEVMMPPKESPAALPFIFEIVRRDGAMMNVNCQSTEQAQQLMQWFLG